MTEDSQWTSPYSIQIAEIQITDADESRIGPFPVLTIRTEEIAEDDLRLRARGWIGAHVRATVPWPTKPQIVYFNDRELFILPFKDEQLPSVFVRERRNSEDRGDILRFLSTWSWVEQHGIQVETWTGGSHMSRVRGRGGGVVTDSPLDFDYWPLDLGAEAKIALAFFREGLSLDHGAYSFLSFFKVINLIEKGNSGQRKIIELHLPSVEDFSAKERLAELGSHPDGQKLSDYMLNSGRHAVAHANLSNAYSVDPDQPEHDFRLRKDLPIIRDIARLVIRSHFNIPTKNDIWKSNTHYISGVIWSIGYSVYHKIIREKCVGRRSVRLPNIVDFRVRGKPQREVLRTLHLRVICVRDAIIHATLWSDDKSLMLWIYVDLVRGRLVFDPLEEQVCIDDGSSSAAEQAAEYLAFWADIVGNGRCQLVESETQYVLAESEAYLPMNWFLNYEGSRRQIGYWQDVADRRRGEENCDPVL